MRRDRNIHPNSLAAFYGGSGDAFTKREGEILTFLRDRGPATDREVMLGLGFSDPNAARPRITELIKAGVLEEVGNKTDPTTGKTVRIVRLRPDPRTPQREFAFEVKSA